jgi:hypothetical protein
MLVLGIWLLVFAILLENENVTQIEKQKPKTKNPKP